MYQPAAGFLPYTYKYMAVAVLMYENLEVGDLPILIAKTTNTLL